MHEVNTESLIFGRKYTFVSYRGLNGCCLATIDSGLKENLLTDTLCNDKNNEICCIVHAQNVFGVKDRSIKEGSL